MVQKQDLIKLLDRCYEIEQEFIARLSDKERAATGTRDHWSAKDILVHSSFWKAHLAENINTMDKGGTPTRSEDYDQANAEIFEEYQHKPWADALALMERGHRALLESLNLDIASDLDRVDIFPWQEDNPLWRNIVGNGYTHSVYHLISAYTEYGDTNSARELNEEMVASLTELDDDPNWRGTIRYNLACFYSISGDSEKAISLLRESLQLVPSLTEWSKEDPDFEPIRDERAYQAIYAELE